MPSSQPSATALAPSPLECRIPFHCFTGFKTLSPQIFLEGFDLISAIPAFGLVIFSLRISAAAAACDMALRLRLQMLENSEKAHNIYSNAVKRTEPSSLL